MDDEGMLYMVEDLGWTEFTYTVQEVEEPGFKAETWVATHEDLTLTISDIHALPMVDREGVQTVFEFLLLNPTDYRIIFGEISVYYNGELQFENEEFYRPFLIVPPNFAGRNEFRMFDIFVDYGDEIIIRGRLRIVHDAANVTHEIVDFTFVL
jgi:hypothetical protein